MDGGMDDVARAGATVDRRYRLAWVSALAGFPVAWAAATVLGPASHGVATWMPYAAWLLWTGTCSVRLTRAGEAYRACVVRAGAQAAEAGLCANAPAA